MFWSNSIVTVCLGCLSCWNKNFHPSLKFSQTFSGCSSTVGLDLTLILILSTLTRFLFPADKKIPNSKILSLPYFTMNVPRDSDDKFPPHIILDAGPNIMSVFSKWPVSDCKQMVSWLSYNSGCIYMHPITLWKPEH